MSDVVFLCTIANRSDSKKFVNFFKDNEIPVTLDCLGKGTASDEVLDILGIGEPEKNIFFTVIPGEKARKVMKRLVYKMYLDVPGNGIAFTVSVSSLGGANVMKYFTRGEEIKKGEEKMERESGHEVILAITNRGYVDQVMEAAKSAGATGGTVVHAKGTGSDQAEKFFGVSIATEKEMVFIVAEESIKSSVMKAIMAEAGVQTKAGTIVFSMPVSDVIGIKRKEEDED